MEFKKGDEVRCLQNNAGHAKEPHFTRGRTYIVNEYLEDTETLRFEKDDRGKPNGMHACFFKKVTKETQMSTKPVHFLMTKNSITLHYGGQVKVIAKEDQRFERVLGAIRSGAVATIPGIVDPTLDLKRAGLDVEDGIIKVDGEHMPTELNAKIMEYRNAGLPFHSLTNFWNNLKLNPSFNSRQQLFKFLENKGHAITEDGCFTGYRGVSVNFKDIHSGKFNNMPGSKCEMPRTEVDDNPNNTCSSGLHVGGFDYAKDFGRNGKLVMVKVNPKDVVAVPNDYNGQKMRVCAFEVLHEVSDMVSEPVLNEKGGKELAVKADALGADRETGTSDAILTLPASRVEKPMTPAEKRAHKRRYSNNHAKRGSDGKFISKKRKKTKH